MLSIIVLAGILGLVPSSAPWFTNSYFVRTGGGTTTQCTGLANADYDGSGTGEACAYSSLTDAITSSACGDTINVLAGQTFDAPSTTLAFILTNKSCTISTPITIRSTAHASLPLGRVSPADASNMPRIRAKGGAGAFQLATNASHWILDGLDITNTGTNADFVISLIDSNDPTATNLTVQRCLLHPKETGAHTLTSVQQAISFEGSGLNFNLNYAYDFFGRQSNDNSTPTTRVLLSIGGNNVTVNNNFMQAWY